MRTLTFSLLIVVLIATVGLGWLFDRAYDEYSTSEKNQAIDAITVVEQLGTALAKTFNEIPNRHDFVQQWQAANNFELTIVTLESFSLPKKLLDEIKSGIPLLLESNDSLAFHYYLAASDELLILKSPLLNIMPSEKPLDYVFTVVFYLALLLLFLLWVYPLIRQLLTLRQAAKSFGEGNFKQRISVNSISYIGDITTEFNHMAQRIENLIVDVKLLSGAVSHDLRTPLARIRFGIDTLQEEDDPALRRRFEQKISDNVDEMTSLVETLLNYARLDQAMLEIKKDKVELSTLIAKCINNKTTPSVDIQFINDGDHSVIGDKSYLTMLMSNLLQNAINYGNGKVIISLANQKDNVIISIEDNGNGIAPAHENT